ncbi:MAG: D-alanine--D-alanine ligase [Planctomycetota bacterium]
MSGKTSRVALLYGGTWEERDVSIQSARRVAAALHADGLSIIPIRWDVGGWVVLPDNEPDLTTPGTAMPPLAALGSVVADGLGVVFVALHGGLGEDGTVQGFLETAGVPYTGARVEGSAICGNKELFRYAAIGLGLEVAPGVVLGHDEWLISEAELLPAMAVEIGFPAIVKPLRSGSSYGVHRVADAGQLQSVLEELFTRETEVLVERFIAGRELTLSCLGTRAGSPPQSLPIIEIEPLTESGLFDPIAKYTEGKARETVPAPLDNELEQHLHAAAVEIHERLDLGATSRVDVILGADGPVILEANTIPGLTDGSLFPQAAAAAGVDFTALCRHMIDFALSTHLSRGASITPAAGLQ